MGRDGRFEDGVLEHAPGAPIVAFLDVEVPQCALRIVERKGRIDLLPGGESRQDTHQCIFVRAIAPFWRRQSWNSLSGANYTRAWGLRTTVVGAACGQPTHKESTKEEGRGARGVRRRIIRSGEAQPGRAGGSGRTGNLEGRIEAIEGRLPLPSANGSSPRECRRPNRVAGGRMGIVHENNTALNAVGAPQDAIFLALHLALVRRVPRVAALGRRLEPSPADPVDAVARVPTDSPQHDDAPIPQAGANLRPLRPWIPVSQPRRTEGRPDEVEPRRFLAEHLAQLTLQGIELESHLPGAESREVMRHRILSTLESS